MSAIERMLNRLEEKILVRSDEVTGQSRGTLSAGRERGPRWSLPLVIGGAALKQPALQGESRRDKMARIV